MIEGKLKNELMELWQVEKRKVKEGVRGKLEKKIQMDHKKNKALRPPPRKFNT